MKERKTMSASSPTAAKRRSPEALGNENTKLAPRAAKPEAAQSIDRDKEESAQAPPLPSEPVPPLPAEAPPDDGWDPLWDDNAQAYYFHNRLTQATQWENPRVPQSTQPGIANHDRMPETAPGTEPSGASTAQQSPPPLPQQRPYGGYDPAIHGDYDPTAPYAQEQHDPTAPISDLDPTAPPPLADPAAAAALYTASGGFNRWTGKWQDDRIHNPENHNDENKSKRQMNAFFDVDAAANSHNGRSLKAERSGKKLSKQELKAFKEKRKERKEEKRRAWLRD